MIAAFPFRSFLLWKTMSTELALKAKNSATDISLEELLMLAYEGEFNSDLSRRKRRALRATERRHTRAIRRGREEEFLDELLVHIEGSPECCDLMPEVFGDADFNATTPLGLNYDGLFDLIDGLLERLPAILDAIVKIMALFASIAFFIATICYTETVYAQDAVQESGESVLAPYVESVLRDIEDEDDREAAKSYWTHLNGLPVANMIVSHPELGGPQVPSFDDDAEIDAGQIWNLTFLVRIKEVKRLVGPHIVGSKVKPVRKAAKATTTLALSGASTVKTVVGKPIAKTVATIQQNALVKGSACGCANCKCRTIPVAR